MSPPGDRREAGGRPVAWRPATLGVAVIAITILPALLTGALGVQIGADTGIGLAGIGGFYGVLFGVSAVASAPTGRVIQRRGWESGIRLSAGGTGTALAALAVLPGPWWEAWWPAALVFAVGGVTAAISQAGSNLALAGSVPESRHGLAFGLKHTSVPLAAILGGLAVPTIALTVGWRWAYAAAAGLAFVTMAAVPRTSTPAVSPVAAERSRRRTATPVATLAALAVAAALAHTGLDAIGAFAVPYAVEEGLAEGTAGLLLSIGSLVGLAVRLGSGLLVDRRQQRGLEGIAVLLAIGALGFAVLAAGGRTVIVLGVLLAFAGGWGWAGLLTFVVVRANPAAAATATGIANTGKYIGAAAGPVIVGLLAERVSFAASWWLAGGLLLGAAIIVVAIRLTPSGAAMAFAPERTPDE